MKRKIPGGAWLPAAIAFLIFGCKAPQQKDESANKKDTVVSDPLLEKGLDDTSIYNRVIVDMKTDCKRVTNFSPGSPHFFPDESPP